MNIKFKFIIIFSIVMNLFGYANSSENFFEKGLELYKNKKFNDAKFMFERSIVFDPKNSNSYLYLAKIYNHQDDKRQEEKNLDTTLLIEPKNEEAVLMLMKLVWKNQIIQKSKTYQKLLQKFVKIYVIKIKKF